MDIFTPEKTTYTLEQIQLTIDFSLQIFEANEIKHIILDKFQFYFPLENANLQTQIGHRILQFFLFKLINPPVTNKIIDQQKLQNYLDILFSSSKKIIFTKEFSNILEKTDVSRLIIEIFFKQLHEYAYLTCQQQLFKFEPNNIISELLESLYCIFSDTISIHLPQCSDSIRFECIFENDMPLGKITTHLIEIKSSKYGLTRCNFFNADVDKRIQLKNNSDRNIYIDSVGDFILKPVIGAYKKNIEINNDIIEIEVQNITREEKEEKLINIQFSKPDLYFVAKSIKNLIKKIVYISNIEIFEKICYNLFTKGVKKLKD